VKLTKAPQVVEQHSAILSIPNEEVAHGLYANHQDMCKFRDADDQNWLPVLTSILDLVALTVRRGMQTGMQSNVQTS
jgi:hypothetical protein